jgi:multiple sugar transport system substrate-binding protein
MSTKAGRDEELEARVTVDPDSTNQCFSVRGVCVMTNPQAAGPADRSRRSFLGLIGASAAAVTAAPLLSACSGGGSSGGSGGGGTISFWDMPWGAPAYNTVAAKLTTSFKPSAGLDNVRYQTVQWTNFFQTFATSVASGTNPAVSSGGGYQAFTFAGQGAIHYVDDLINGEFKKNGLYDDFLPGVLDKMKTPAGYVAVPSALDLVTPYYRKSLHDQLGLKPPATWDELYSNGVTFRKKTGLSYMISGGGPGNPLAGHTFLALMINNGGGLFTADQQLDCLNDRNVEAMDFALKLVKDKVLNPAGVNFTLDNEETQWKSKQCAFGYEQANYGTATLGEPNDVLVTDFLTGPHGNKLGILFVNNLMIYSRSPSIPSAEAFLTYYLKNYSVYWQQGLLNGVPVLKSVASLPAVKSNVGTQKIISDLVPYAVPYSQHAPHAFPAMGNYDAGSAINTFAQTMLTGQTTAKAALSQLQSGLASEASPTSSQ